MVERLVLLCATMVVGALALVDTTALLAVSVFADEALALPVDMSVKVKYILEN